MAEEKPAAGKEGANATTADSVTSSSEAISATASAPAQAVVEASSVSDVALPAAKEKMASEQPLSVIHTATSSSDADKDDGLKAEGK